MTHPSFEEEDWEAGISSMLATLPLVEPPPGLVDHALDHRPLYAGRIFGLFCSVAIVSLVAWVGFDVATRATVVPPVSDLVAHHDATSGDSTLGAAGAGLTVGDDKVTVEVDESVTVFRQAGSVSFNDLPAEGRTEIDGVPAWVDPERQTVVVQAGDEVVTIVGVDEADVADVVAGLPTEQSPWDEIAGRLNGLTAQLGFADLD